MSGSPSGCHFFLIPTRSDATTLTPLPRYHLLSCYYRFPSFHWIRDPVLLTLTDHAVILSEDNLL